MPVASLTDTRTDLTYIGLLHAQGEPLPSSGLVNIYDGYGNQSSISVGRNGAGATVSGLTTTSSLSTISATVLSLSAGLNGVAAPNVADAWALWRNNTLVSAFKISNCNNTSTGVYVFSFTNSNVVPDGNYVVNCALYNNSTTPLFAYVDTTLIDNTQFTVKVVNTSGVLTNAAGVGVTIYHL